MTRLSSSNEVEAAVKTEVVVDFTVRVRVASRKTVVVADSWLVDFVLAALLCCDGVK